MQVVDLMTTDVITVSRETGIRDAARLMFRNRVSGLPVTSPDGSLIGIITEADFLRLEVERQEGVHELGETVGDVMSAGVVTTAKLGTTPVEPLEGHKIDLLRCERVEFDDDVLGQQL